MSFKKYSKNSVASKNLYMQLPQQIVQVSNKQTYHGKRRIGARQKLTYKIFNFQAYQIEWSPIQVDKEKDQL